MKLSKLYANQTKFKPIMFNPGFNIIYGDVENNAEKTNKVQAHNIGKTALIYLIDFLLLKKNTKDIIFRKYAHVFSEWVFFLEIKLNNGEYLTIRRSVHSDNLISFKKHSENNQDFTEESSWDHENLRIGSKIKQDDPSDIFESYLNFDSDNQLRYRVLLSYLLRTQNDYRDVFKMTQFKGQDKTWKPDLFGIIGFDATLLNDRYALEYKRKEDKSTLKNLGQSCIDADSEVYKLKATIEAKENQRKKIQESIDSFDFFNKEKTINLDLVYQVEAEIAAHNKTRYQLDRNIQKINESLTFPKKAPPDIDDIKQLYDESALYFPDSLEKDYKAVSNFHQQITKERERYLNEELRNLEDRHREIDRQLSKLNDKRRHMLSLLKEKDSFMKYKQYQKGLEQLIESIGACRSKLDNAKNIEEIVQRISESDRKIKDCDMAIRDAINQDNDTYRSIRTKFSEIVHAIFEYEPVLVVEPNRLGNVNFEATVLTISEDITGKADGYTTTKILCAGFVLSLLSHYADQSFFKFAYHDGILESCADNHKPHFIKTIQEYCNAYDLQYIISMIRSDESSDFTIDRENIVRKLSKDDPLFGITF